MLIEREMQRKVITVAPQLDDLPTQVLCEIFRLLPRINLRSARLRMSNGAELDPNGCSLSPALRFATLLCRTPQSLPIIRVLVEVWQTWS